MKIRELLMMETGEEMQNNPLGGDMGAPMASISPSVGTNPTGMQGGGMQAQSTAPMQGSGSGDWMGNKNMGPAVPGSNLGGSRMPGAATPPPAPVAPMKTAGLWDMAKDFITTPQPIGGSNSTTAPTPPAPSQGQNPPGSNFISRATGTDTISKALLPK